MIIIIKINNVEILNVLDCSFWLRLLQFAYLVCKIYHRLVLLFSLALLLLLLDLVSELHQLTFLFINSSCVILYLLIESVLLVFQLGYQAFDFSLHVLL